MTDKELKGLDHTETMAYESILAQKEEAELDVYAQRTLITLFQSSPKKATDFEKLVAHRKNSIKKDVPLIAFDYATKVLKEAYDRIVAKTIRQSKQKQL